jgi:predicted Zn-dependent protease
MRCLALLCALAACGEPQLAAPVTPALKLSVPATLETRKPHPGDARTVHVRVWADAGVRALPHWKDDITDELDYTVQFLTPFLGLRLQVESINDWDRTGDPHAALDELAKADPGKDAMWVIGFVAPPDTATTVLSELGDAKPLGHHLVVRAWNEQAETAKFLGKIPAEGDPQRVEFLGAHRRHKEAVVLLHELAASLGAIEVNDPTWIMHPAYGIKISTFSERNRELMQLALDAKLADDKDDKIARQLVDAIDKSEWGGWIGAQRDQMMAALRNIADSTKAGRTATDVPPAAYEQFDRVREMRKRAVAVPDAKARAAQLGQAVAELDNLLTAYPANASMHELKCEMMLDSAGPKDANARAACGRVSELAAGDPTPHFAVGEALIKAGDLVGARAELVAASKKIGNLEKGQPEAWHRLVGLYVGMGALTWTEEALAQGKLDGDPAAAAIATTRARDGVPRGAAFVKPEDEAALVTAVVHARTLINASKHGEAEKALAAAEKKWPGAAGLLTERCELLVYSSAYDAARAQCDRALKADPDASWALYLSGVIALRDTSAGGTRAGVEKLKRAIAVDPELGPAWRTLGKAYSRLKDKAAFQALDTQYQAKFNQALSP